MQNSAVQASVNSTECLISSKSSKEGQPKDSYLKFFHSKSRKKDRHKLSRKTRYWINFLNQENYLLTSLEEIFKDSLSGGRENPYITLSIENKNLFFYRRYPTEPYYLEKQKDFLFSHLIWREQEQLNHLLNHQPRQFRKKWQEIKTKVEVLSQWNHPTKLVAGYKENGRPKPSWEGVGWNSPDYWEPKNRSLAALAFTHEIVLGKIGTDTPLLDLDPNKKDSEGNYRIKQEWLRKALSEGGKKWKALINKHQIPYYWKTATPGNSCLPIPYWLIGSMKGGKIYHQGQEVADLLAGGDLVALPVGSDKSRQLVITKWGKQLVKKHGVGGVLKKKLLDGDINQRVEELLNTIFLTLDKSNIPTKLRPITREYLTKKQRRNPLKLKQEIQAKVLSKYKVPLSHLWKAFYLDWKTKRTGYFLVNDYHREQDFNNLEIGSIQNILLVNGYKHQFLSRLC